MHRLANRDRIQPEIPQMPRMTRNLMCVVAASAVSAPTLAVFTGIDLREDKGQIPPLELAQIDPLGLGVRVINLYATFDGPGDPDNPLKTRNNIVVLEATRDPSTQPPPPSNRIPGELVITKSGGKNANAAFYQDPFGGNLAPQQALIDLFPALQWDTFVGIGRKTTPVGEGATTFVLPDFAFLDKDLDGQPDGLAGAWAITDPDDGVHYALLNPLSSQYEVFLAQFAIVGLDADVEIGRMRMVQKAERHVVWETDVFSGGLTMFAAGGGEVGRFTVDFVPIPAPATSVLALPGAITFSRRSRRNP